MSLSEWIRLGLPHRAIIRQSAMIIELVVSDAAISKCKARIAKHVNKTPYLFSRRQPIVTIIEPK